MSELLLSRLEMNCYARYLLNQSADEQSLSLFERAIQHEATILTEKEERLLQFMLNNTWSVPLIDAATGLFSPKHKLRKRMIIAFAILETNPLYFNFFQPKQYSVFYLLHLTARGFIFGVKALAGGLILILF